KKSKERIEQQLEELWDYAQSVAKEELKNTESVDFRAIDTQKVKAAINTINAVLKEKKVPSKVRQKLNYAKKNWPKNLEKYKQQE
ncbi:IS1182 family transposase, partial [Flavobacterium hibisci]|nr:IS1182 family transposase [Flavobacterium hibisci]